jgi:hypothetical protein
MQGLVVILMLIDEKIIHRSVIERKNNFLHGIFSRHEGIQILQPEHEMIVLYTGETAIF